MFVLATALIALGVLFFLTELALAADERVRHPFLWLAAIAATLAAGIVVLLA